MNTPVTSRIFRFELVLSALAAVCAITLAAASAPVAPGNPAGMNPLTPQSAPGTPAQHEPNNQDRLFVRELSIGGMAETDAGKLAYGKSTNQAVREFAARLVSDHDKANQQLDSLAHDDRLTPPRQPDMEHRLARQRLEKSSGAMFDRAYLDSQIIDHQKTAQLLEWEIDSGQEAALRQFAEDTLPVVLQHLTMARQLEAGLASPAAPPA